MKAELLDVIDIHDQGYALMLFTSEEWEDRVLPIRIDLMASFAIKRGLGLIPFKRPLTHDLLVELLNKLEAEVEKVTIDALVDGVYIATIFVKDNRSNVVFQLDARPSDATAIAVRTGAPIYIAEHLVVYTEPLERYQALRARYGFNYFKSV